MGERKRYALSNLGGGLNQGADPTAVNDNEQTVLENWFPRTTRLDRRNGLLRLTATPFAENINGIFAYKTNLGTWKAVVGGTTQLGVLDGTSVTSVPFGGTATAAASSNKHWSFEQYKDVVYTARPGGSRLWRTDAAVVLESGIDAPGTAPTLAQGAAGSLLAGDYIGVVTFYNTDTAAESNPSPISATLSLGANKKITWSNIPTSTNPQVKARRLYRTLAGQQGAYFLVTTLTDNFTTSYTDDSVEDSLGTQASFDNGLPPNQPQFLEVWQERMWTSDKRDLYFSGLGLPESYSEFDIISITPDDGHEIKGLLNFGDKLLVGKSNAVYTVTTIDGLSMRVSALTTEHGVFSHFSMVSAENFAFWFGGDNFYQTDGNGVRAIGDVKIRTLVDSIDPDDYDLAISVVDETLSHYITAFPTLGKMTVYNYRTDGWTVYTYRGADASLTCPSALADFFDEDLRRAIYCNRQGGDAAHLFQYNVGNLDDGTPIECTLTSKYFGFGDEDMAKIMGDIELHVTPQAEDIDVSVLGDDAVAIAGPVSINLFNTRKWFRIPLATNGQPAHSLALKIDYMGTKPVSLLGYGFSITNLERRVPVAEAV